MIGGETTLRSGVVSRLMHFLPRTNTSAYRPKPSANASRNYCLNQQGNESIPPLSSFSVRW